MRQRELLVSLLTTICAVRAIPLQPRDGYNPLGPLKSVASELLGFTTAISGLESSAQQTQTTLSASSTDSTGSVAATGQASTAQTNLVPSDAASSTTNSRTGTVTVTATDTQSSTGSVSPTNAASNSVLLNTATTTSAGVLSTSPGSPGSTGAPIGVVPTTTESSGSSHTSTGSGPGSSSGSGPGSGGNTGTGSTSADSAGGAGLSPGEIAAAVILPVLALAALLFLLFRFCNPLRERYSVWRQERLERSAYRRALDDPILSFGMHQQNGRGLDGLGMGDVEQLVRPLSFGFRHPQRQYPSIKRKPLNWDAARIGGQGASSIGMAIPGPIGQRPRSLSEMSGVSDVSSDAEGRYQDARSNQTSREGIIS
ncbi:uncharacterized protein Z520_03564 [Fonsecaea multimorphosa CBS 102226]|uniref:Uncharacterized protein n=1 Tax=Fonsecaea multimorphosa CBS 102226 TaxID=1442371 RepID=A0A0D2K544_9EURO|nr:uncharacterized protein Z520_03564 [Fonsecaea multimorphosa CBS 102226]KIY00898.1 hypothetical protein Z520_03564 [Fonsecaea multimorphosa CBS 102226]OAL27724.1 hypothetical protein AYO22_03390 [Fonsecaea multimorphosa]